MQYEQDSDARAAEYFFACCETYGFKVRINQRRLQAKQASAIVELQPADLSRSILRGPDGFSSPGISTSRGDLKVE